ncbi:hypothetical protein [Nocardia jejuensis]|uniref:hypothetical protein n=1 Tax=Nocardia jejuensis TaxID=328049 RepID=UPI000B077526|nr:hypothetical protein [Nocardia jejuensis]
MDREIGAVWELRRQKTVLARITVTGEDEQALLGTFAAEPEFGEVAPLFLTQSVLGLLSHAEITDSIARVWEGLYDTICRSMVLIGPSGPLQDFELSIYDTEGEFAQPGREATAEFDWGYRDRFAWWADRRNRFHRG